MSREFTVYARASKPIPIATIVARLHELGREVVWESDPLFRVLEKKSGPLPWRMGALVSVGSGYAQSRVNLSHKALLKEFVKKQARHYESRLSAAQKTALMASKRGYEVSGKGDVSAAENSLLELALEAVAELGDGIILDHQRDRFFSREEWLKGDESG